jgi:hypothetical protein
LMAKLGTKARLRLCSTLKRLEQDESWGLVFCIYLYEVRCSAMCQTIEDLGMRNFIIALSVIVTTISETQLNERSNKVTLSA